jgi:DNA (cytosine-5)-methyltransferase 1
MTMPVAVDLFSGCGGLTLGLKLAGFEVLSAVEIEKIAADTYEKNHPEVLLWRKDIKKLSAAVLLKKLGLAPGQLDLLAGCPPCQGFSAITNLNGVAARHDPRNDLVFQFLRFARVLKPKAVMMENVPGLSKDPRIEKVLKELERMGYAVNSSVLNAADYGVPQRRRRFILLGGRKGIIEFAKEAKTKKTVRDAFAKITVKVEKTDLLHNLPQKRSTHIKELIRRIPRDGGSRQAAGEKYQLECHKRCDGFKDVYGRMAWDVVAPTITGGCFNPSKGRFLHPSKNRAISLREAALLQSFPISYKFSLEGGKTAAALMIGNALPPEFIRRQASQVKKYLVSE